MFDVCFVALILLHPFGNAYSLADIEGHPNFSKLPIDECGESMSDRIVGGKEARLGQYPWLARVGYSLTNCPYTDTYPHYMCGGSLITDMYVMTAAHCVVNNPPETEVCEQTGNEETIVLSHILLGEHDVDEDPDCDIDTCADPTQMFEIVSSVYHKLYDHPKLKYDIALIKMDRPATFTGWVSPICLPFGEMLNKDYIGHDAEVAGWGIVDLTEKETSQALLYVQVPIVEMSNCKRLYSESATLSNAEICAGGIEGEDSCGGDSGGPLMFISSDMGQPKYYQLGLVSFGAAICGTANMPAVYTNIIYYMEWILDNLDC